MNSVKIGEATECTTKWGGGEVQHEETKRTPDIQGLGAVKKSNCVLPKRYASHPPDTAPDTSQRPSKSSHFLDKTPCEAAAPLAARPRSQRKIRAQSIVRIKAKLRNGDI